MKIQQHPKVKFFQFENNNKKKLLQLTKATTKRNLKTSFPPLPSPNIQVNLLLKKKKYIQKTPIVSPNINKKK